MRKIVTSLAICGLSLLAASAAAGAEQPSPSEPESVRVCDAFGRGYFYIPGTETCLQVSAQVRVELGVGGDVKTGEDMDAFSTINRSSFRINASSDTEIGTVRSLTEHRFNYVNGVYRGYRLHRAVIQAAGFQVGVEPSVFQTFDDDYGDIINDSVIFAGGSRTSQISYLYKSPSGISAVFSIEQGGNDDSDTDVVVRNNLPYFAGGLKYADDNFSTSVRVAYDSLNSAWASKFRIAYGSNSPVYVWAQIGYKTNDDHYATETSGEVIRQIDSFYGTWGGDLAAWTGVRVDIGEKTKFNAQVAYDSTKTIAVAANIVYTLAPDLIIMPELSYTKWQDSRSSLDGREQFRGDLRLQYRF